MVADRSLVLALRQGTARLQRADARRALALLSLGVVTVAVLASAAWLALEPGGELAAASVDALDTDGDGVPDVYENAILGRDPAAVVTDGLPDAWVRRYGLDIGDPLLEARTAALPPEVPAVYGSRLPEVFTMRLGEVYAYGRPADWEEARDGAWDSRLDPNAWHVGGAGVPYGWLIFHGLDPLDAAKLDIRPDIAGVTWTPREAYALGLHPRSPDGDADGLPDVEESRHGTLPWAFSSSGTGIADGWLVRHGFDPRDASVAHRDTDLDGLTNVEEFQWSYARDPGVVTFGGLDPRRSSTVGGPIPDGWLVAYGLDPRIPDIAMHETERAGGEGVLLVWDEYRVNRPPSWNETLHGPWMGGTDPTRDDTDGDGVSDLREMLGWLVGSGPTARRVHSDPTRPDSDDDGLLDGEERAGRSGDITFPPTDPNARDTDYDGLTDGEEVGIVPWRGMTLPATDPTRADTDDDGIPDGDEADMWATRATRYVLEGARYEWGPEPRPIASTVFARGGRSLAAAVDALRPDGDIDGDGLPNLLDPDSDGDGLLDGWEVRPEMYRETIYAAAYARSATDPANPDTDLDGLPDAWEHANALYDPTRRMWNLDPSRWSSFQDATSDGDRDLDDDGILWYAFHHGPSGVRTVAHEFRATNRVEYEGGSHPNRKSSSPDGISDGWKLFWGNEYPLLSPDDLGDIYPGAPGPFALPPERPLPRIGAADLHPLAPLTYVRYESADVLARLPWETSLPRTFTDSRGETVTVRELRATVLRDYRTAAENATNPYLDDTDGDSVPDAWEGVWSRLGEPSLRVSPVKPDGSLDVDGDGLDLRAEYAAHSDPYRADSDHGGIDDGSEVALGLDPSDPLDDVLALDAKTDSDGDGIPDNAELLRVIDGGRRTDPHDPDTDHDGLLDGERLSRVLGRTLRPSVPADAALLADLRARGLIVITRSDGTADIFGEKDLAADPTRTSTSGEGIPDGWLAARGYPPGFTSGLLSAYTFGRPAWWQESAHGVWHWGLEPGAVATRDHDRDGLDDLNGEDPYPYANPSPHPLAGDPREPGIPALDVLTRAQAYGSVPAPTPVPPRVETRVVLDPLPTPLAAGGSARFSGNVTTLGGEGVAHATVLLAMGSRDVVAGVAISDAAGAFNGTVALGHSIRAPEGSQGIPVFGRSDGRGEHENAAAALARIDPTRMVAAFAWTYNVSPYADAPADAAYAFADGTRARGAMGNVSAVQRVDLGLPTRLAIEAASRAAQGTTVVVNVTLTDVLGRPVADRVIAPDGTNVTLDANGGGAFRIIAPDTPGPFTLLFRFVGSGALLPVNGTFELNVYDETRITLSSPPLPPQVGESFTGHGVLLTESGRPIRDAPVTLRLGERALDVRTRHDGTFQATFHLNETRAGASQLEARFAGNRTLDASAATLNVTIQGSPRWEADDLIGPRGARVEITARLSDARGEALAARAVTLSGPDGRVVDAVTDAVGRVAFPLDLGSLSPGDHGARLMFISPTDGSVEKHVRIIVTASTTITLVHGEPIRGKEHAIAGRLTAGAGGLARQPVDIVVGRIVARVITDDDGRFTLPVRFDGEWPVGALQVHAAYLGTADGIMRPSEATTSLTLRDAFEVRGGLTDLLRERPVLEAAVVDLLGAPAKHLDLRVTTPGGVLQTRTDLGGRFTVMLPVAQQALGPFSVTLHSDATSTRAALSARLDVALKDRGELHVSMPTSGVIGARVTLGLEVVDGLGRPVEDAVVSARLDERPVVLIQRQGPAARFDVPNDLAPGPHELTFTVTSSVVLVPEVRRTFDALQPTRLTLVSVPTLVPGESGVARVRLTTSNGPIAGAEIIFQDADGMRRRVTTDVDGVADVPLQSTRAATDRAIISYAGSDAEAPTATEILTRTAAPAGSHTASRWPLLLGGIGLALMVGTLVALKAKRSQAHALARAARRLRSDRPDVAAIYELYAALLRHLGMEEAQAETATFADLLRRAGLASRAEPDDVALAVEIFDRAVYAPDTLTRERYHALSIAFSRMLATQQEGEPT